MASPLYECAGVLHAVACSCSHAVISATASLPCESAGESLGYSGV